jgi:hypothetical protein
MLARLAGPRFLAAPRAYRVALFEGLRELALERIDQETEAGLSAVARIRSRLLRAGQPDAILELGRRTEAFTVDARIERAEWTSGRLAISFRALLTRGPDARPLTFLERDGAMLLEPAVADDLVGPADMTDELAGIRAQLSLVERATALEWLMPGSASLTLRPVGDADDEVRLPAVEGHVELDPQRVGPGERPLDDGSWDVTVRWLGLGLSATGPLRFPRRTRLAEKPPIAPALLGRPVRWVVPRASEDGSLRIAVGGRDRLPARIDDRARRVVRDGRAIAIALPIASDRFGRISGAVLGLEGRGGRFAVPAAFDGARGRVVVSAPMVAAYELPRGRYELTAHLGSEGAPGLAVGAALVRDDGRFVLLGVRRDGAVDRMRGWWYWTTRSALHAARLRLRSTYRQLPQPAREAVKAAIGRLRG